MTDRKKPCTYMPYGECVTTVTCSIIGCVMQRTPTITSSTESEESTGE